MKRNLVKGKKADFSLLAVIIITLAAAIGLWLLYVKIFSSGIFGEQDRQLCRTSVLGQSAINVVEESIVPLKCGTYQVKFYEDHVEINGKTKPVIDSSGKQVKEFESLNDNIVNQVMAEELRLCWWQFWEGKRQFGTAVWGWNGKGDNCFVCNEVEFDPSVKNTEFKGFFKYINETTVPGKEYTYFDYLSAPGSVYNSFIYTDPNRLIWDQFADGIGTWSAITTLKFGKRDAIERDISFKKEDTYIVYFDREGDERRISLGGGQTEQGIDASMTFFSYVANTKNIGGLCDSVNRGTVS